MKTFLPIIHCTVIFQLKTKSLKLNKNKNSNLTKFLQKKITWTFFIIDEISIIMKPISKFNYWNKFVTCNIITYENIEFLTIKKITHIFLKLILPLLDSKP